MWEEIATKVSDVSGIVLEKCDVKTKWSNLRQTAKLKKSEFNREARKTGGGENLAEGLTKEDERICSIIGKESIDGIEGGFDTEELFDQNNYSNLSQSSITSAYESDIGKSQFKKITRLSPQNTPNNATFEKSVLQFQSTVLQYKQKKLEILQRMLQLKEVRIK
jgi:hypothetical protein